MYVWLLIMPNKIVVLSEFEAFYQMCVWELELGMPALWQQRFVHMIPPLLL